MSKIISKKIELPPQKIKKSLREMVEVIVETPDSINVNKSISDIYVEIKEENIELGDEALH